MRIVVGLGNPGREYARTRHNVGFMVVDRLAGRWRIDLGTEAAGRLIVGHGVIDGTAMMLVKPQRYMNRSGQALRCLKTAWRAEDLIVVHDDMDLVLGRIRVRHDGGYGGHRGLQSIGAVCGPNFDRVRVGIGRPPTGARGEEHVLAEPDRDELLAFEEAIDRASLAVECILTRGLEDAMNRFNVRHCAGSSRVA